MEKEILTKRHIIHDIKITYYQNLFAISLMVVLAFAMYFVVSANSLSNIKYIFLIGLIALSIYAIAYIVIGLIKVSLGTFTIVSDKVIKKLNKRYGLTIFTTQRPYTLVFSKYGKYGIPGKSYTWSKAFKENDNYIYKTTNINDEFYIARVGKSNIIAYNKNLFAIDESPTFL